MHRNPPVDGLATARSRAKREREEEEEEIACYSLGRLVVPTRLA
jgi:hypothetical protein